MATATALAVCLILTQTIFSLAAATHPDCCASRRSRVFYAYKLQVAWCNDSAHARRLAARCEWASAFTGHDGSHTIKYTAAWQCNPGRYRLLSRRTKRRQPGILLGFRCRSSATLRLPRQRILIVSCSYSTLTSPRGEYLSKHYKMLVRPRLVIRVSYSTRNSKRRGSPLSPQPCSQNRQDR